MAEWGRSSWWVIVFCAITGIVYFHSLKPKQEAMRELAFRIEEIRGEKIKALEQREDFRLAIASENDPAWIEMILMRDLGVVPEGFLKVHFKN